jgi:hypothetical protein
MSLCDLIPPDIFFIVLSALHQNTSFSENKCTNGLLKNPWNWSKTFVCRLHRKHRQTKCEALFPKVTWAQKCQSLHPKSQGRGSSGTLTLAR